MSTTPPPKSRRAATATRDGAVARTVPGPASVLAVGMAFAVLEELARTAEAVGTSELARRLGETKARVHRHLATLRELGFVQQDAAYGGYRLGWNAYRLSMSVTENFELRKLAHAHVLMLHQESGQTVALAMPAGVDVTVIDAIQSTGHVAITVRAGSVIPAASSALGRAILAFQPEAVTAAALATPIEPLTGQTLSDPLQVGRMLDEVRRHWYAVAISERLSGVAALAAPVFDDRNCVVASVAVIGSQTLVTQVPPAQLLSQVQTAAAKISAELGSTAWQGAPHTKFPHAIFQN